MCTVETPLALALEVVARQAEWAVKMSVFMPADFIISPTPWPSVTGFTHGLWGLQTEGKIGFPVNEDGCIVAETSELLWKSLG